MDGCLRCKKKWSACQCSERCPYTHHGPTVHGSKLADYLVSEMALRDDYPEMFKTEQPK